MNKSGLLILLLIIVIAACAGCTAISETVNNMDTSDQDDMAVEVFNAFENCQYDSVKDYFYEEVSTDASFSSSLQAISNYIEGTAVTCTKTGFYYNTSINNERRTNTLSLTYNIETEKNRYVVSMNLLQTSNETWKIYGYNVTRAEELKGNGAIINFDDFDIMQLLLLIYSAACFGFMIFSIVLCAKAKIRLKALWIIIILCQAGFILTRTARSFNFNLQVITVTISSLRKFVNGDTILTVIVPLGAILFLCLRKRLVRSAAEYEYRKAMRIMPPMPTPAPIPADAQIPQYNSIAQEAPISDATPAGDKFVRSTDKDETTEQ